MELVVSPDHSQVWPLNLSPPNAQDLKNIAGALLHRFICHERGRLGGSSPFCVDIPCLLSFTIKPSYCASKGKNMTHTHTNIHVSHHTLKPWYNFISLFPLCKSLSLFQVEATSSPPQGSQPWSPKSEVNGSGSSGSPKERSLSLWLVTHDLCSLYK